MELKISCTRDGVVKYPMHTHKNYEIMLYLEGNGHMCTEHEDVPFAKGTIVIVPPDIKHGSVSENGFKNISISGDFEGYFNFDTVKALEDNDSEEGSMLARMIYNNRYGNDAYLSSLCTAYICFIMQLFKACGSLQKAVEKIVVEISQYAFDSQIDLARLLQKSGYSEDYIRSCFKQFTGKTPNDFLTDIRIRHACFLIDVYRDELSLNQISAQCGYIDYVYFSKKFKSVMGLSPSQYQKNQ